MSPRSAGAALAMAMAVAALSACGGGSTAPADYRAQAARACPGVHTGARSLRRDARDPAARISAEVGVAARAARLLGRLTPPPRLARAGDAAVQAMQGQVLRLSLVAGQLERGSRPAAVLDGARAGLLAGDRQTQVRLAALGVGDCGS